MQLHGSFTSPFVRHCRIVMLQNDTQFEFIETDYAQSAEGSSTMRVPYLFDGDIQLHDSSSIIHYLREKNNQKLYEDALTHDLFLLVNTALDSTINLFLLEKSGVNIQENSYAVRQRNRIERCLQTLNAEAKAGMKWNDVGIRLACFIDWALYRQRLDFSAYPALLNWLEQAKQYKEFNLTAPPA